MGTTRMIHEFQGPFVYWTEVDNHASIKSRLMPFIKKLSENNNSTVTVDGSTSTYYHQTYPYITGDMLEEIVWKPLDDMMNTKGLEKPEDGYGIEGLWWNNYTDGGRTQVHKHERADWSGVYVLHLEGENTTTFCSQYGQSPNSGYMNEIKRFSEVPEGCVMIFPSFMQHYADVSQGNRIIVSFDITYNKKRIPLTFGT